MMAGTDLPNAVLVPGYSLLRELDVMVEAGIPRPQVLEAATSAPARFFGQSAAWGTITEGAEANLLLVDGNPLESFRPLGNPAGAVLRGRYLDSATLAMMRHATAAAPE
jgi:imidazolonepropionase-like amidohydrolase